MELGKVIKIVTVIPVPHRIEVVWPMLPLPPEPEKVLVPRVPTKAPEKVAV